MNAAATIEEAIDKLTATKLAPEPPYFSRWNDEDFTYGNLDDAVEEGFDYGQAYGEWVATHRTIDAQLSILTAGNSQTAAWVETQMAVIFAKAILGDDA